MDFLILANSAGPDEMLHSEPFHQVFTYKVQTISCFFVSLQMVQLELHRKQTTGNIHIFTSYNYSINTS